MRRQRGWAFLIVLIALVIVAFLARDALLGALGGATAVPAPREKQAHPAPDGVQAAPAATSPVERARGVEATVVERAEAGRKRIDERAR